MRKMTYKQAATCGENLKARVTPEQSEKIKQSWRDAEKRVYYEVSCGYVFLWRNGNLTKGDFDEFRYAIDFEEIELIEDPQSDFASQQEVFLWIVQGNFAKREDGICGFKNGKLCWHDGATYIGNFECYAEWQKYTPPRLIRVNGVEVPAPVLLELLDELEMIYLPNIVTTEKPIEAITSFAKKRYPLDLCYATKEDAIKRAEAMLKFEVVE